MRQPVYTPTFKKDRTRMERSGKNTKLLDTVLKILLKGDPLLPKYYDHGLHGQLDGYRECHIQHDWLLMYKTDETKVSFVRTGTHSDLYD